MSLILLYRKEENPHSNKFAKKGKDRGAKSCGLSEFWLKSTEMPSQFSGLRLTRHLLPSVPR